MSTDRTDWQASVVIAPARPVTDADVDTALERLADNGALDPVASLYVPSRRVTITATVEQATGPVDAIRQLADLIDQHTDLGLIVAAEAITYEEIDLRAADTG